MIGCVIVGTLAAMGIARAIHHRRCWAGGCGRHGWRGWGSSACGTGDFGDHGFGRFGGGGGGRSRWQFDEEGDGRPPWAWRWGRGRGHVLARTVVEYVRATPAQERAILSAFDEFGEDIRKASATS